jgi:hypothetical protein
MPFFSLFVHGFSSDKFLEFFSLLCLVLIPVRFLSFVSNPRFARFLLTCCLLGLFETLKYPVTPDEPRLSPVVFFYLTELSFDTFFKFAWLLHPVLSVFFLGLQRLPLKESA